MPTYYDFDEVLLELQISADELKRQVSEGEIRAFRDEDRMKFRCSDIEGLRKGHMTEPTIILPLPDANDAIDDESSEVLLVEDDTAETYLDVTDLVDDDTASETLTEELVFDDADETFIEEPALTVPIVLDEEMEEEPDVIVPQARRPRPGPPRRPEKPGNPWMSSLLVGSSLALMLCGFLVISLMQEEDNAFVGGLTDLAARQFPIVTYDAQGQARRPRSKAEVDEYLRWRQGVRTGSFLPTRQDDR